MPSPQDLDDSGPGWWCHQLSNEEESPAPPAPRDLLEDAIEASGLSARAFARDVLLRDERTIRRWLAGDSPIPEAVMRFLEKKD